MYIKRYTLATIMLLGFIVWYVHEHITKEMMSLELFNVVIPPLHIAFLVIVPAIILFIFTIFHMSFYSIVNSLKLRKYKTDSQEMVEALIDAYMQKLDREHKFKTDGYKLVGKLIDNSTMLPNKNITKNTSDERINNVLRLLDDIEKGSSVDLKGFNLKATNPISMKNNRNKFNNGDISAKDILDDVSNYDEELCKIAYIKYSQTYSVNGIVQYKSLMSKEALMEVLKRVDNGEHSIEISNEILIELFESVKLTSKDYIEASMVLANGMDPERRIKFFETLSEKKEIVMEAYLYTLFDLEMLSVAEEILENSQPDEFLKFKAYSALKENNNNFSISLFL